MKIYSHILVLLFITGCSKETITVNTEVPSSYAKKMVGVWDFTTQTITYELDNVVSDHISKDNIIEFNEDGWGVSTLIQSNFMTEFQWAVQENPDSLLIVEYLDIDNQIPFFDLTKVRMFNIEVFDYDSNIGRTIVYMTHKEKFQVDSMTVPQTIETRYVILKDD